MGPQLSSDLCNYDLSSCLSNANLSPSDYISKILHLTKDGILICGTIRQGVCQIRSYHDLSVIRNGSVPVSPNSVSASCVSLIDSEGMLFVASTYAVDTPYRESFPAISSRSPPDYYIINSGSIEGEAAVHIRAEYRQQFHVNYITGFFHKHYIYFISTQNKFLSNNILSNIIVSKLIRICKDDERYISYSEIELQCRGTDNRNFNIITSAVLMDDLLITAFTNNDRKESVMCLYSMQKITLTFWYNIDRCRIGSDTTRLAHIGRDNKCVNKSQIALNEDTCAMGVGSHIECDQIAAYRVDFQINSLAAITINEIMLGILGTNDGRIIQIKIDGHIIEKYNEFQITQKNIEKLFYFVDQTYFAVSKRKLYKLSLSNCESFSSCFECISSYDPLCGWCLLEGKCIRRNSCQSDSIVNICPLYNLSTIPSNISVDDSQTKIFLPLGDFSQFEENEFICKYDEEISSGQWSDTGIICATPKNQLKIPSDSLIVDINVFYSTYNSPVISKNIIFYNCSSFSVCSHCLSSKWSCRWCSKDKRCIPNKNSCSNESANNECLRIDTASKNIIMPEGSNYTIILPVVNADNEIATNQNLYCKINIDENVQKISASLINDKIFCNSRVFSSESRKASTNVKIELIIDDSLVDVTTATLYSCQLMASDCSTCFALDPQWKCSWCESNCKFLTECPSPQIVQSPDFLCSRPIIESFKPQVGPKEGGTVIEIRGKELGSSLSDVKDRVFVGSHRCAVINYEISTKIDCKVESGQGSGAIRLRLGQSGRRFVDSQSLYQFVDPQPKSIHPLFGPMSGGTKLTIYGSNLHIGSNVSVFIGAYRCEISPENNYDSAIMCRTSRSNEPRFAGPIRIEIDKSIRILERSFEYRHDPVIKILHPTMSYESGGRNFSVMGNYLDSVLNPKIFFLSTSDTEEILSEMGRCHVQNATLMFCVTPRIILPPNISPLTYSRWPVGFLMDGVKSVRNLRERIQVTIVPDPQFEPLKGIKLHVPGQLFTVNGNHLSHAATADEYFIYIGTSRCTVVLIDNQQIMCRAPEHEPLATDAKGSEIEGGHPMLTIIIGSLKFELGLVEYETIGVRMPLRLLLTIIFVLIATCFLTGVILCFIYSKKRNEREKEYKKIQLKMEHLEFNVRNECKQAFAELQTDVSDAMTIDGDWIPFQEQTVFISHLLHHNITLSRSVLISAHHTPSDMFEAMRGFDSLLSNKRFLFLLIQSIENNPICSLNERSYFSSLIITSLMNDISYCTEVVFLLLNHHMNKCIRNRNAQLIFRQSSSVVEKIFAYWFSICLFDSMKSDLGQNLYLLYKALKYQIEKGPIDAINGNARYSLNEQKLLREPIDAATLHLLVIPLDGFNKSPILIRVLTCDTISQVKMKLLDILFKNEPFSSRMTIEQFDLEWNCQDGPIILHDKDRSKTNDPIRLNRVSDYNIPNNSLLSMQPNSSNFQEYNYGSVTKSVSAHSDVYYHLEKPGNYSTLYASKIDYAIPNSIPEIYLTRLLTSKGTIQKYLDDFFDSLLYMNSNNFPFVLKYVFDFMDNVAQNNNLNDSNIIHCWKTNIWILRFWVNLLSNVNLFLDVQRTNAIDGSLTIVAQTLVDIFSASNCKLGKESPSSKLLFAKDIERYRPSVALFFRKVQKAKEISSQQFFANISFLAQDRDNSNLCLCNAARSELLSWLRTNDKRIIEVLSMDNYSKQENLSQRLKNVLRIPSNTMDHENIYATVQ